MRWGEGAREEGDEEQLAARDDNFLVFSFEQRTMLNFPHGPIAVRGTALYARSMSTTINCEATAGDPALVASCAL